MTDQEKAYDDALRQHRAAEAWAEGATPLSEGDLDRMGRRWGPDLGVKVAEVEGKQRERRAMADAALADLSQARQAVEMRLGRPMTRHEAEAGFGGKVEHEWWLSNPRDPCPECVSPEVAAMLRANPRTAYRALLGRAAPRLPRRGHSEACDCRDCVPYVPEPQPLTPAEEARRAEQKARLSEAGK